MFRITDCDFGITYNNVNYDFPHVISDETEDPQMVHLIRGNNAKNKKGLVYTEGMGSPLTRTITLLGVPRDILTLLQSIYDKKDRLDCYAIDRKNGSKKVLSDAILRQKPRQLSIAEGPDSLNVLVVVEGFDDNETDKDETL